MLTIEVHLATVAGQLEETVGIGWVTAIAVEMSHRAEEPVDAKTAEVGARETPDRCLLPWPAMVLLLLLPQQEEEEVIEGEMMLWTEVCMVLGEAAEVQRVGPGMNQHEDGMCRSTAAEKAEVALDPQLVELVVAVHRGVAVVGVMDTLPAAAVTVETAVAVAALYAAVAALVALAHAAWTAAAVQAPSVGADAATAAPAVTARQGRGIASAHGLSPGPRAATRPAAAPVAALGAVEVSAAAGA